jgi:hypothetical protein
VVGSLAGWLEDKQTFVDLVGGGGGGAGDSVSRQ